jgi:hypothetical protein
MKHVSIPAKAVLDRIEAQQGVMGAAERELHTLDWSPLTHLAAAQEAIKLGLLHRAQEHIALAAEKWIGEHL